MASELKPNTRRNDYRNMELFAVQIELSELTQVIWTKSVFV